MNETALLRALCRVKQRRESALPQMIRFFEDHGQAQAFLRRFSGMSINVPKPKELDDLLRDASIARSLSQDSTATGRAQLCKKHRVTHRHLREVYQAAYDRKLSDTHAGTVAAKSKVVRELLPLYPKDLRIVSEVSDLPLMSVRAIARELA